MAFVIMREQAFYMTLGLNASKKALGAKTQ